MSDHIVATDSGSIKGKSLANGVRSWLGIPYAKANRFELAQNADTWSDTLDATTFGDKCPQMMGTSFKDISGKGISENCLNLNIWAPAKTKNLKPVLFWIHGGAFVGGSGDAFSGHELVSRGDIVVVSINYRLGVLGFVNFDETLKNGEKRIPSNLGLRDQLFALQWVHKNIAAFGGDPNKVTIAGESAGSCSCAMLMHIPESWPYYRGAILQSGATTLIHSRERSQMVAKQYVEALNLENPSIKDLQTAPLADLFQAQKKVLLNNPNHIPASPWFDDDLLGADFQSTCQSQTANIPILAGFNKDEIRLFEVIPGPKIIPVDRASHARLIENQFDTKLSENILNAYTANKQDNRKLGTHISFALPTLHFAERHSQSNPVWFYRFDAKNPLIGAAHALELLYLWPLKGFKFALARGGFFNGWRKKLGLRMQDHWIHFVKDGRPGNHWPAFNTETRSTMVFNKTDSIVDDPESPHRERWQNKDVLMGK
jgi:para-nitrobenzyl esterase